MLLNQAPLFRGPRHTILLPSGQELELTPEKFGHMVQELVDLEGPSPPYHQATKMKRARDMHGWKSRSGLYREALNALSFDAKSTKSIGDLLYMAAALGNIDLTIALLRSGANPNHVMEEIHQDYPLLAALRLGNLETANALLQHNANVNILSREIGATFRYTPLAYACEMMELDLVRNLLDRGAKVNPMHGWTPTLMAFCILTCPKYGGSSNAGLERIEEWKFDDQKQQIMDILIDFGADVDFVYERMTLFNFALLARSAAFAKYLIHKRADCNIPDPEGDRPLHLCIYAWVKAADDEEAMDAIESILKCLLDAGASWRAWNDAGKSARDLALSLGDKAAKISALFPVSIEH